MKIAVIAINYSIENTSGFIAKCFTFLGKGKFTQTTTEFSNG